MTRHKSKSKSTRPPPRRGLVGKPAGQTGSRPTPACAKAKKFYAVHVGRSRGVYEDWGALAAWLTSRHRTRRPAPLTSPPRPPFAVQANKQVSGVSRAVQKSFRTRREAEAWLKLAAESAGPEKRGRHTATPAALTRTAEPHEEDRSSRARTPGPSPRTAVASMPSTPEPACDVESIEFGLWKTNNWSLSVCDRVLQNTP